MSLACYCRDITPTMTSKLVETSQSSRFHVQDYGFAHALCSDIKWPNKSENIIQYFVGWISHSQSKCFDQSQRITFQSIKLCRSKFQSFCQLPHDNTIGKQRDYQGSFPLRLFSLIEVLHIHKITVYPMQPLRRHFI